MEMSESIGRIRRGDDLGACFEWIGFCGRLGPGVTLRRGDLIQPLKNAQHQQRPNDRGVREHLRRPRLGQKLVPAFAFGKRASGKMSKMRGIGADAHPVHPRVIADIDHGGELVFGAPRCAELA